MVQINPNKLLGQPSIYGSMLLFPHALIHVNTTIVKTRWCLPSPQRPPPHVTPRELPSYPPTRSLSPGHYSSPRYLYNFVISRMLFKWNHTVCGGFPGGSDSKESTFNTGDLGSVSGWGSSLGEGTCGYSPQYFCLENFMDRGAWWATVHRVPENRTRLSNYHFHLVCIGYPFLEPLLK